MKATLAIYAFAILIIEKSSPNKIFQNDKSSARNTYVGLWQQGIVPYEVSQQFGEAYSLTFLMKLIFK